MAEFVIGQFTNKLNQTFSLGQPESSKTSTMRETVTYPKIKVTAADDPCFDPSLSFEHVLSCGHLVNTALSSEPCAPNCHHVAGKPGGIHRTPELNEALKTKDGQTISGKLLYCDACVEMNIEKRISSILSSTLAEAERTRLRSQEASNLGKATKYRKCYIASKIVSIPCNTDGTVLSKYTPRKEHHPFDTSVPQIGENMFEDIDPNPKDATPPKNVMEVNKETHVQDESHASEVEDGEIAEPRANMFNPTSRRDSRMPAEPSTDDEFDGRAHSQRAQRGGRKRTHLRLLEDTDDDDMEDEEDGPPVKRKRATPVPSKSAKTQKGRK